MRQLGAMILFRSAALAAIAFLLADCGALAPVTTGPAPTTDDALAASEVAICYSKLAATPEDVRTAAAQECSAGTKPQLVSQDMNMDVCPVLTPVRATFSCTAP